MARTDAIAVIGAGPCGLSTALALARQGIPVTVYEAEPALTLDLRAGSYHPPTVEMLTELGVGEAMHALGIKVPVWQIRDRVEGVVAEFDLGLVADETPFPYRLHLEQHRLTPLLLAELQALDCARVRFSTALVSVSQSEDEAILTFRNAEGETETATAPWVVGCDGARSVVRRHTSVEFEGFTWPERFLVASMTNDMGGWGFSGAGYIADPENWAAVFNVPDAGPPGLWRVAYPTNPDTPEEIDLAEEEVQRRLAIILEHVPERPDRFDLRYRSTYRVHQRVATCFFDGRLILAGDAAHLNNPMGGLGLNGSVHDAVNLAEKLGRIWRGEAEAGPLLDLYDRQRRPVNVEFIQAMSIRNKRMLEERDPETRRQRLDEMRRTASDPALARAFLMNTSMINSVRKAASIR